MNEEKTRMSELDFIATTQRSRVLDRVCVRSVLGKGVQDAPVATHRNVDGLSKCGN